MISLVEHPELEWTGRLSYLSAKAEIRNVQLYTSDLIWKLVQVKVRGDIPMPSEIWMGKNKVDRRSGKQIMGDLLKGLGGE